MRYSIKENTIIKCKWCNKEFHPINPNNKYCSPECSRSGRLYNRREKRKILVSRNIRCLYCGKSIIKKTASKFCSKKCRLLYRNLKRSKYGQKVLSKLNNKPIKNRIILDNSVQGVHLVISSFKDFQVLIKGKNNTYYWEMYKNGKLVLKSDKFETIKEAKFDANLACR